MTEEQRQIIEITIERTLEKTFDRLGINPKTYKEWISKNHAVTVLGIGRKKLDSAIRRRRVRAEYNQKTNRWLVMRKDVEDFVNRGK